MNFEDRIKELSCEELEKKRKSLSNFIFSDSRKLDSEILNLSVDKLTIIENEIENRENIMREILSDPQDLVIIDWEDEIKEQMEIFYK